MATHELLWRRAWLRCSSLGLLWDRRRACSVLRRVWAWRGAANPRTEEVVSGREAPSRREKQERIMFTLAQPSLHRLASHRGLSVRAIFSDLVSSVQQCRGIALVMLFMVRQTHGHFLTNAIVTEHARLPSRFTLPRLVTLDLRTFPCGGCPDCSHRHDRDPALLQVGNTVRRPEVGSTVCRPGAQVLFRRLERRHPRGVVRGTSCLGLPPFRM